MLALSSRRAAAFLSCSVLVGGIAGCGSGNDAGGGSSSSASSTDATTLLQQATWLPDGQNLQSFTGGITVSGTVDSPKDKDVRHLEGKAAITVRAEHLDQVAKATPPFRVTFDIDGKYTSGSGKDGTAKYTGGATYLDKQLYVNWKGKDYAFGTALTEQIAQGFNQELSKEGSSPKELQKLLTDPKKQMELMDLDPSTWIESPKTSDGPRLDGVDTTAVSGQVDIKAAATDLAEGFKKLPSSKGAPGMKDLNKLGELSDADVKKAEKAVTKRELTIYIGNDDKVIRRVQLAVAGKDDSAKDPTDFDLTIQLDTSKINQPQDITAPKNAAPVTDLFSELQKDFPGIGGLLA